MSDDKSEAPSPKRLRQAREEGNVPKSKDLTSSAVFLVGMSILGSSSLEGSMQVMDFTRRCLSVGDSESGRLGYLAVELAREGALLSLTVCVPVLAGLFFLTIGLGFAQTGGLFTLSTLGFKLDKMNPVTGIQNIFFSAKGYVELLKNLAKLFVAGYLGYSIMYEALPFMASCHRVSLVTTVSATSDLVAALVKNIGGFMVIIGAFDYFYQRHTWYKGLMMSKQEQKDEYKQSEGDPHTKGERKKLAKELLNQKGTKAVKQAKVVVTNPHDIAVALEYDSEGGMSAPQVLCKGERLVAKQIIEEAEKHGIPIMQNIALAHSLNELEAGDEIPEDLYEAVAEVLNWVYAMQTGAAMGGGGGGGDWDDAGGGGGGAPAAGGGDDW